ncbi:MAG: DUF1570 domain-containing protein [Planctomycetaceae bacterium]|nr:DUF1570 domain-containing protein [Planctomycetaceae bacterium]
MSPLGRFVCLTAILFGATQQLFADAFTYVDERGAEITTQATLTGTGQGFHALERWDGQIQLIPTGSLQNRDATGDPEPIDSVGMQELLSELFGEENVRFDEKAPFLVCMVIDGELDKQGEQRCSTFLKKASTFMKNVDSVFMRFAKQMRFPTRDLRYPLVLLIFESDQAFEKYADLATGGRSVSAVNIAGFYSSLTNWLAVRMSSCDTFEVPLHEAIHQQMYNRVLQRLAPIPKWFDEGIATGFEADGQNIKVHPLQVNSRYARQAQRLSTGVDWQAIIANDGAFTADVLAGDAYTLAWCLHWMLVTTDDAAYRRYVEHLADLEPLADQQTQERVRNFEAAFDRTATELQAAFAQAIDLGIKRQKVDLRDKTRPGFVETQQHLGAVQLKAIGNGLGSIGAEGKIKNISPLRSMTFYVTIETAGGQYTGWLITDLRPSQTANLAAQIANRPIPGARPSPATSFQVWIRSVAAGSAAAERWKAGELPGPVMGQ